MLRALGVFDYGLVVCSVTLGTNPFDVTGLVATAVLADGDWLGFMLDGSAWPRGPESRQSSMGIWMACPLISCCEYWPRSACGCGSGSSGQLDHYSIKAEGPVKALSFDKHGSLVLAACNDDTLWLWSGKGDPKPIKHNFGKILALSQDATKVAAQKDEGFAIWDIAHLVK